MGSVPGCTSMEPRRRPTHSQWCAGPSRNRSELRVHRSTSSSLNPGVVLSGKAASPKRDQYQIERSDLGEGMQYQEVCGAALPKKTKGKVETDVWGKWMSHSPHSCAKLFHCFNWPVDWRKYKHRGLGKKLKPPQKHWFVKWSMNAKCL